MLIAVDAPFSFSLGRVSLSVKGSKMVWVWIHSWQKKFDHLGLGGLRVAGKIIINSNENMLGTYYATKCPRRCSCTEESSVGGVVLVPDLNELS